MEQEIGTQEVSILPPEEMMGKVGAMEKEHHDRIREYVKWFADSGVPHKVMVESGDPAETIARIANDINADLIVMGHHHKSSIFDIFSTDVAARTIKSAPCDVTLVAAKRKL
ncbi:MAG: universal stress protein [Nitrospinae bacterium]|nr:universal stress protein [Nitrospinota bacterium]